MKKIYLVLALFGIAASAGAQNFYDALQFAGRNYGGTARTIGMGNAVTALGGDLGSLTFNPAGSAVASYSQFTLTPSLSFSINTSAYDPACGYGGAEAGYGNIKDVTSRRSLMNFPNIGYVLNLRTGNVSGLRGVSFGVTVNTTDVTLDKLFSQAVSPRTSFMGSLAYDAFAKGYSWEDLDEADPNVYYGATSWQSILAYNSELINSYKDQFLGSTESVHDDGHIYNTSDVYQTYKRQQKGLKRDLVLNLAFNFSDNLYVGANLGFPIIEYSYRDFIREEADDYHNFKLEYTDGSFEYFNSGQFENYYSASAQGLYLQVGAIYVPTPGLRLGASIQTPTILSVNDAWYSKASTEYNPTRRVVRSTPDAEDCYDLVTPFKFDLGVAYAVQNIGLISLDYEGLDYSMMRYREADVLFDDHDFDIVNGEIRRQGGWSHMLRAGVECTVIPQFALRMGYTLTTSPEAGYRYNTNALSAGFGYYSRGSFFTDFAFRMTKYAQRGYAPYGEYLYGIEDWADVRFASPFIVANHKLLDAVLTLGWRF